MTLIEGLAKAYKYLNVPLATENETNNHQIDKKQPNKAYDKIIDILGKIDTFETANNMQNSTKNEENTIAILKYLDDKFHENSLDFFQLRTISKWPNDCLHEIFVCKSCGIKCIEAMSGYRNTSYKGMTD